jgi:hypothetical protein
LIFGAFEEFNIIVPGQHFSSLLRNKELFMFGLSTKNNRLHSLTSVALVVKYSLSVFSSSTNPELSLTLGNLQFTFSRLKMQKLLCHFSIISLLICSGFSRTTLTVEPFNGSSNGLITSALSDIVREFASNHSEGFDFIIYGQKTQNLSDIANELAKAVKAQISMLKFKDSPSKITLNRSAIILFDTFTSCRNFHANVSLGNNHPKDFNFLSYVENADKDSSTSVIYNKTVPVVGFLQFENFLSLNVTLKALQLFTLLLYQQPICKQFKLIEINQFSIETEKWKSREFSIEKYNNYNGCDIKIKANNNQVQIFYFLNNYTGEIGYGVDINKAIGVKMNFTFTYIPLFHNVYNLSTFNHAGADIDFMSFSFWQIRSIFGPKFVSTTGFTTVDDIVLISRFPPHSKFEKIFMPFEIEVWHWLIATLVIALAVICGFKLAPTYIRKFVFGSKVQTPIMNLT